VRTIRIDEEVWLLLQSHAKPLMETPIDVLRRLLLTPERRRCRVSSPIRPKCQDALQPQSFH